MKEWLKDNIVGGLILAIVTGIAVKVLDIDNSVVANTQSLINLDNRVDRIANVLPEVKARVAQEDITQEYTFALMNKRGHRPEQNQLFLFDYESSQVSVWMLPEPVNEQLSFAANSAISGIVTQSATISQDLASLEKASFEIDEITRVPHQLDATNSFVLRGEIDTIQNNLIKAGWSVEGYLEPNGTGELLPAKALNYPAIIDSYNLAHEKYKIVPAKLD